MAEDNLFEFDYRRDAPCFHVFLSRQAMSSAKQHYEEQQREAHHRLLHSFNWLSKTSQLRLANHNSLTTRREWKWQHQPGQDDIKPDVRVGLNSALGRCPLNVRITLRKRPSVDCPKSPGDCRHSQIGIYGMSGRPNLLRLDVRRSDHLSPFLGFLSEVFSEIRR